MACCLAGWAGWLGAGEREKVPPKPRKRSQPPAPHPKSRKRSQFLQFPLKKSPSVSPKPRKRSQRLHILPCPECLHHPTLPRSKCREPAKRPFRDTTLCPEPQPSELARLKRLQQKKNNRRNIKNSHKIPLAVARLREKVPFPSPQPASPASQAASHPGGIRRWQGNPLQYMDVA